MAVHKFTAIRLEGRDLCPRYLRVPGDEVVETRTELDGLHGECQLIRGRFSNLRKPGSRALQLVAFPILGPGLTTACFQLFNLRLPFLPRRGATDLLLPSVNLLVQFTPARTLTDELLQGGKASQVIGAVARFRTFRLRRHHRV